MDKEGKKILVVDDEVKIVKVISSFLESKGYCVFAAEGGNQAIDIFERENISLVVLDLMLPDISGERVCSIIRKKSRVPIIILTAKADENNLLEGLRLGADDYIIKPFSLKELHARMEAVFRRVDGNLLPLHAESIWSNGYLTLNFENNIFMKKQEVINLTPNESKILWVLVKNPGKVFNRTQLIELALGTDFDGYDRAIDSHIKNLRHKLEDDPRSPMYIITVHGIGYKFGGE